MSFGFSIGDIWQVAKTARSLRKAFIDAPTQFRAISDELKTLSGVLQDLEDCIPEREIPETTLKVLIKHVADCRTLLEEVEAKMKKYHVLDQQGHRVRRIWKRLRWEPEDIKEVRLRLTTNLGLLSSINGHILRHTVSEIEVGVEKLNRALDSEEFMKLSRWLTTFEMSTHHNDIMVRRQKGTGGWFLTNPKYDTWLESKNSLLYCPGMPGAGKTMVAAGIIDDLRTKFNNDPNIGLAFLYFSYKRQLEQTTESCISSLIVQLASFMNTIPEAILTLYKRHRKQESRPSLEELTDVLRIVLSDYDKVYIVLDALDEYSNVPGEAMGLLSEIIGLQTDQPERDVNLLATSRPNITEAKHLFESAPRIEIRANEDDVLKVIDNEMSHMPGCVRKSPELQGTVRSEITKAIDGMFLLARLHMNALRDKLSKKAVLKTLQNLPRGKEALNFAYTEAIERIEGKPLGHRQLAKRVLLWITHARKPLSTIELQHALSIELDNEDDEDGCCIDEDSFVEVDDMILYCEGLVAVDEKSNIIRLAHYTTQEYFERINPDWMQGCQEEIAITCLKYLSAEDFEGGRCVSRESFEARIQSYPLITYCANNWGHHVRDAGEHKVDELALKVLEDNRRIANIVQIQMASSYDFTAADGGDVPFGIQAVHLCGQFGLATIMMRLFEVGAQADPKDEFGRTPLSYAAEHGHVSVVKSTSFQQDVDYNSRDHEQRTPLSWAAGSGHLNVVSALLEKPTTDINSKDCHKMTPLIWAARKGHTEIVERFLLREETEVDAYDDRRQTPLSWAAYNGHLDTVKRLIHHPDVELCSKDHFSQTPFAWAAYNGNVEVVKYLAALPGMCIDRRDDSERTPLMWAANQGHADVVGALITISGVDVDAKDEKGQTPLSLAAREGHLDIVKMLADSGLVDLQSKDHRGFTAERWAAWNGNEAVARLLSAARRAELTRSTRI